MLGLTLQYLKNVYYSRCETNKSVHVNINKSKAEKALFFNVEEAYLYQANFIYTGAIYTFVGWDTGVLYPFSNKLLLVATPG